MNKPVFPSYQELLNEEAVSVPEALRLDTQPNIANDTIATDVWTDRSVFEKEVEHLWPKVWQMVCREAALQKAGDYYVCLLYTSPSPRDKRQSRMPSSA